MAATERRRRFRLAGVALAALLGLGAAAGALLHTGSAPSPVAFHLTDADGGDVTEQAFRGRYLLVVFGYTYCPDYCPGTLMVVADVLGRLPPAQAARVTPLFVTVDPERDSPARVAEYARAFGSSFVGLGGTPAQIEAAKATFRISATKVAGSAPDRYTIDHSVLVSLIGPDGQMLAQIPETLSGRKLGEVLTQALGAAPGQGG